MINLKNISKVMAFISILLAAFCLSMFTYLFFAKTYYEMNYYKNLHEIYSQIEIVKEGESL